MGGFMRFQTILLSLTLGWLPLTAAADYGDHPSAEALINRVAERGVDRDWLQSALSEATRQESILKAISRPRRRVNRGPNIKTFFSPIAGQKRALSSGGRIGNTGSRVSGYRCAVRGHRRDHWCRDLLRTYHRRVSRH